MLDAVRLGPADDATAVTAAQLRDVVEQLVAAGQWVPGEPDVALATDAGYHVTRPARGPAGHARRAGHHGSTPRGEAGRRGTGRSSASPSPKPGSRSLGRVQSRVSLNRRKVRHLETKRLSRAAPP
ncbi:hypothetical protein [Streptomyces sp. NPDC056544]